MNILSLDSPYSPFFSLIVKHISQVTSFHGIFSKSGYIHYFSGEQYHFIGDILASHSTVTEDDYKLAIWSNNHYSAYIRKFEKRELNEDETSKFAKFANFFRSYLRKQAIDFVMMHNDLRWHHAIARKICIEEGIPFCVSELGLFRPYTTTLDFFGVNANSSVTSLEVDFTQYADCAGRQLDVPNAFHGHESKTSKLNFAYFLLLNKIGGIAGRNSPILHNPFRIRPYIKRFWEQSVKRRVHTASNASESLPEKPYVFFPMQLENDTQFLIHSDFSSNQSLLEQVERAFYNSTLSETHQLVVKLHPNDLGCYEAKEETLFTKANTTKLVNQSDAIVSVNSTVCMEAIETDKPLFVLGRAFFAREDVCQPISIEELSDGLSNPKPVDVAARKGFINYLKYEYSVHGAGYSYTDSQLKRIAKQIEHRVKNTTNIK
ncbi:capsular biosynthesis protein [Vibrio sp. 16]|uniref:capsular polysaccharide export protein, LipB/KpsS family n=1 Tax=Vibrio sp. 16 TaxID=391586 RepID=UPI002FF13E01